MLLKRGTRGEDVKQLQLGLTEAGLDPGAADGIFGARTEETLEAWQQVHGLIPDGVFGRSTRWTWNAWWGKHGAPQFVFPYPVVPEDPAPPAGELEFWEQCPATPTATGHGYERTTLRRSTAVKYLALYQAVKARGAIITSAGGRRPLASKSNASRSVTSFHYLGRAHDLATYSALGSPTQDPFICVRDPEDDRRFIVWARVQHPERAPVAVPEVELDALVGRSGPQLQVKPWRGRAFNFTALAQEHGFSFIRGRRSFWRGTGSYMGAEWWHMQDEEGLVRGETTFGSELLRVYTPEEARKFVYWSRVKDAVYGVDWG